MNLFSSKEYVLTALEIGTSKICAAIAALGHNNRLRLLGVGQSPSRGVRKARVVDKDRVANDIRRAIAQAEQMAGVIVDEVILAIQGNGVWWDFSSVFKEIRSAHRPLSSPDIGSLKEDAKMHALPQGCQLLYCDWQELQDNGLVAQPTGKGHCGYRVGVKAVVVYAPYELVDEKLSILERLMLDVQCCLFAGIASAMAVTDPTLRRLGVLVIDIGAGCSSFTLFYNGFLEAGGTIPVGGAHVTVDIATYLERPIQEAEEIKLNLNSYAKGEYSSVSPECLQVLRQNYRHIECVCKARMIELFDIIRDAISNYGVDQEKYSEGGVILTGGGAQLYGSTRWASEVFGVPARLGKIIGLAEISENLDRPEFATTLGLLVEAQRLIQQGKIELTPPIDKFIRSLKQTLGIWRKL